MHIIWRKHFDQVWSAHAKLHRGRLKPKPLKKMCFDIRVWREVDLYLRNKLRRLRLAHKREGIQQRQRRNVLAAAFSFDSSIMNDWRDAWNMRSILDLIGKRLNLTDLKLIACRHQQGNTRTTVVACAAWNIPANTRLAAI
ncbi:MAG TPA: hypothetical protein VFX76_02945 [Roseiflexaceae bacterium]|nr:hypothetical protein [Roseiflexaceae bacterium]